MKIANADLKGSGNQLSLQVTAIAPTLGWTNVSLSKVENVAPPQDRLQEIVLLATPPNGPAATAVQIFELSLDIETADWFQGVRIRDTSGDQIWSLRNPTLRRQPIGSSPFSVGVVEIKEDKLSINVQYGGGCKTHIFQLNWDGNTMESLPPQVVLELSHNSNGDNCLALLNETLQFDLSTLEGFTNQQVLLIVQSPGKTSEILFNPPQQTLSAEADNDKRNELETLLPTTIKRGFSNNYDLGEAVKDAIRQLPDRSGSTVDFLASYKVINIGAQIGGIAGFDRLFVDVEG